MPEAQPISATSRSNPPHREMIPSRSPTLMKRILRQRYPQPLTLSPDPTKLVKPMNHASLLFVRSHILRNNSRNKKHMASKSEVFFNLHLPNPRSKARRRNPKLRRLARLKRKTRPIDGILLMILDQPKCHRAPGSWNAAHSNPPRAPDQMRSPSLLPQRQPPVPVAEITHQVHRENVPVSSIPHAHQAQKVRPSKRHHRRPLLHQRHSNVGRIIPPPLRSRLHRIVRPQPQSRQAVVRRTSHLEKRKFRPAHHHRFRKPQPNLAQNSRTRTLAKLQQRPAASQLPRQFASMKCNANRERGSASRRLSQRNVARCAHPVQPHRNFRLRLRKPDRKFLRQPRPRKYDVIDFVVPGSRWRHG